RPRLLPVCGEEIVPADAARRVEVDRLLLAGTEPLEQSQRRPLRVGDHRKAADVGDFLRRYVHRATEMLDPLARRVDVVDRDIAEPARLYAGLSHLLGQIDQPTNGGRAGGEEGVPHSGD